MQVTPEDRACHEWACRIVYGFEAEEEVFVLRNLYIVWGDELETGLIKLEPSSNSRDAVVATLAQVMKLYCVASGLLSCATIFCGRASVNSLQSVSIII